MAYQDQTVEQLKEEAKSKNLVGYSTKNKDELVQMLEENDAQDGEFDSGAEEADSQDELVENLSDPGQEAVAEYGQDSEFVAESGLELDASGPLVFQSPDRRVMTGAVSEEHAKEQEELTKDVEDHTKLVTEAGTQAEVKGDVQQEDVIDFPPPVGLREGQDPEDGLAQGAAVSGAPFATSAVAGARDRTFGQKGVFYTDGVSGGADHNLERAYHIPEVLQSNNPVVRKAGDESESEAYREEKPQEENERAESVINRDEE